MMYSIPYRCIGSEGTTISIPAAAGHDIIAVLVDGYNKDMVTVTPLNDNEVMINEEAGVFTLGYSASKGLQILVMYKNKEELVPSLNDFEISDFSSTDFY